MTEREVAARAAWDVEQRRVECDCGRVGKHAPDCRLEVAWDRAMRRAASELRREEAARAACYAAAVAGRA